MSIAQDPTLQFIVPPPCAGQSLRIFLGDSMPLEPEDFIRQLIKAGRARLNGQPAVGKHPLAAGDVIVVDGLEAERKNYTTESVRSDVLHEDPDLIILNKPPGCTVVRERHSDLCPFQNGVLDHLRRSPESVAAALRDRYRPRAVHRLDRDTTGAIVVAKSRAAELRLFKQFQERTVLKEYLAVVHGAPAEDGGAIDAAIAESAGDLERMEIHPRKGRPSQTAWEVVERFRAHALILARPRTGRRHQIRIHLAHIGLPIIGDRVYGGGAQLLLSTIKRGFRTRGGQEEKPLISRPALHARALTFLPVGRDEPLRVEAPLPRDMETLLKMLRKYAT
jgi:23S rRNA pseudouridine1911/1915/1917 synthase